MDVRCEKCHTEYELDDAKVTDTGVTVKCTSCGNLFKIRRKSPSVALGAEIGAAHLLPDRVADADPDKLWMIRSVAGEVSRFRELTTLQQWIVERRVTRDSAISRTGETWKRLGDINELALFFQLVDQAVAAVSVAGEKARPRRATLPIGASLKSGTSGTSGSSGAGTTRSPSQVFAQPRASVVTGAMTAGGAPGGVPRGPASFSDTEPMLDAIPRPLPSGVAPSVLPPSNPGLSRGYAVPPEAPRDSSGPSSSMGSIGSMGSLGRTGDPPAEDPAWAQGGESVRRTRASLSARDAQDTPVPSFRGVSQRARDALAPGEGDSDENAPTLSGGTPPAFAFEDEEQDPYVAPRSNAPWLVAAGLILLAGGVGAYLLVGGGGRAKPAPSSSPPSPIGDAAAKVASAPSSAGPAEAAPQMAPVPEPASPALEQALARFYDDTDSAYADAEKKLEMARAADPAADAKVLAAMAFLNSSWAQYLTEDAASLDAKDERKAEELRAEAARKLVRAETFVKQAFAAAPKLPEVLVAAADVRRQKKGKAADVHKLLEGASSLPEATYVRAMVAVSAGESARAETLLKTVAENFRAQSGREHWRARYQLAKLDFMAQRADAAKMGIDTILSAQPEHPWARALKSRVAQTMGAPPPATEKPPAEPGEPSEGEASSGSPSVEAYDGLVSKGDRLAENGSCPAAVKFYEKALDARPGGVEALTGLGYCYLDGRDYVRAQSNFRAALGISPRFGDALIGIAEAYRFQGNKEQAVTYYQKYLDANPAGAKAIMARRHVGELAPRVPEATPTEKPPERPQEAPEPPKPPAETPPAEAPTP